MQTTCRGGAVNDIWRRRQDVGRSAKRPDYGFAQTIPPQLTTFLEDSLTQDTRVTAATVTVAGTGTMAGSLTPR